MASISSRSPETSRPVVPARVVREVLASTLLVAMAACGGGGVSLPLDAGSHDGSTKEPADAKMKPTGDGDALHADGGAEAGRDATDAGHDTASPKLDGSSGKDGARADAATDATGDAPVDAPVRDHGDASTTFPAFKPYMPHVVANGGAVLAAPQIVTVTWPNEANVTEFETFGDVVGGGAYWAATTSEYGIGPAVSGPSNHVHVPDLPLATMSASDVVTFIQNHATNFAASGWPAPTPNTIYILYLSAETDLTFGTSNACTAAGGYHDTLTINGVDTVYAVIPHCQANGATETLAASHELIEASTDPHPEDLPAYLGFDTDHLAWDIWGSFQDELGDACEFYTDSFFQQPFVDEAGTQTYGVQRTWSNASAALGHDPCQPAAPGPYYNVAPIDLETISLTLNGLQENGLVQTQGYHIAKGETKTFAVGLYSDAPTGGPWTLTASENGAEGPLGPPNLTVSLDSTTGQNGNIVYVTVTVNSVNPSLAGELVTIQSQLGSGPTRYLPILISSGE